MLQMGLPAEVLRNSLTGLVYQRLLPGQNGPPQLLCDTASQTALAQLIEQPQQCFIAWQQALRTLYGDGQISRETAVQFQYG